MSALNFTGTGLASSQAFMDLLLAGGPTLNKTPFLSLIFSLSGLTTPGNVLWTLDPNPFIGPADAACVKLRVKRLTTKGRDDYRDNALAGWREITISFRCETYNRSIESSEILNRIVSLLQLPSSSTALNYLGLAYSSNAGSNAMDYVSNERAVNVSLIDITFNAANNIVLDPYGGAGFIQTADVSGTLLSDGNPVNTPSTNGGQLITIINPPAKPFIGGTVFVPANVGLSVAAIQTIYIVDSTGSSAQILPLPPIVAGYDGSEIIFQFSGTSFPVPAQIVPSGGASISDPQNPGATTTGTVYVSDVGKVLSLTASYSLNRWLQLS